MEQLNLFKDDTLPVLYKQASNCKIHLWKIWTKDNVIFTEHGTVGGKLILDQDIIKTGKNKGKVNETTPESQAKAEAKAKWKKRKESGMFLDYNDALNTKIKKSQVGGYLPMLAQTYTKHKEKLIYPAYTQPKLNGIRCISVKEYGDVVLYTRTGKTLKTVPHINRELNVIMKNGEIFDGELYIHNGNFSKFTGALRADVEHKEIAQEIKYHIYDAPRIEDLVESNSFRRRHSMLAIRLSGLKQNLILVPVHTVTTEQEAMEYFKLCISENYEGIMFRNIEMPYEQKRSYNLLKYKEFQDIELPIIGFKEGRGKLEGHVAKFICELPNGDTVDAKLKGELKELKRYYENPDLFMGKLLNIKFFEYSDKGIPIFPVGMYIRDVD